jgi:hypothetical protein
VNEAVIPRTRYRKRLIEILGAGSNTDVWMRTYLTRPPTPMASEAYKEAFTRLSTPEQILHREQVFASGNEDAIRQLKDDPDEKRISNEAFVSMMGSQPGNAIDEDKLLPSETIAYEQHKFYKEFSATLPAELRQNCNKSAGYGSIDIEVDYLSDKLAVELKHFHNTHGYEEFVHRAIFHLMVVERLTPAKRKLAVIIVGLDSFLLDIQRLQADAQVLGVQIITLTHIEQAAKLIATWEAQP